MSGTVVTSAVETLIDLLADGYPLAVQRAAIVEMDSSTTDWYYSYVIESGGLRLVTEMLRLMEHARVSDNASLTCQ